MSRLIPDQQAALHPPPFGTCTRRKIQTLHTHYLSFLLPAQSTTFEIKIKGEREREKEKRRGTEKEKNEKKSVKNELKFFAGVPMKDSKKIFSP